MFYKFYLVLVSLTLATFTASAHAGASDKLRHFISSSQSGQANFTQVVQDKNGKKIQSASGIMQFIRPGKFRWE
jgi:outer membrane lipoprotein carrier protein